MSSRDLEVIPRGETAIAKLDPQALIQQAIEKGSGIETLERLFELSKEVRAEQAKEAWYDAMARFQKDCPPIVKTRTAKIQSSKGSYSYSYAPLDEITRTIAPIMGPLGLSVSWRTKMEPSQIVASCRVSHALGHFEESGGVAMPIPGQGESGATAPQRVGIAMTYAKRYALLAIIGLAPEDDDDGRTGPIAGPEGGSGVEMPRRKSEAPAVTAQGGGEGWSGVLAAVTVKKKGAKKDGSPYTLYEVKGKDGELFQTFSDSVADVARSFVNTAEEVALNYENGQYGRTIKGIEATGPGAE